MTVRSRRQCTCPLSLLLDSIPYSLFPPRHPRHLDGEAEAGPERRGARVAAQHREADLAHVVAAELGQHRLRQRPAGAAPPRLRHDVELIHVAVRHVLPVPVRTDDEHAEANPLSVALRPPEAAIAWLAQQAAVLLA